MSLLQYFALFAMLQTHMLAVGWQHDGAWHAAVIPFNEQIV